MFSIVDKNGEKNVSSGLLLYKGGSVCPRGFDDYAAIAICFFLGYENENEMGFWISSDMHGMYERKLKGISCSNKNWRSCVRSTEGVCFSDKDVFLKCKGKFDELPQHLWQ